MAASSEQEDEWQQAVSIHIRLGTSLIGGPQILLASQLAAH